MDETLHRERLDGGRKRLLSIAGADRSIAGWRDAGARQCGLSDRRGKALPWSPSGYGREVPAQADARLLDAPHGPHPAAGYHAILDSSTAPA